MRAMFRPWSTSRGGTLGTQAGEGIMRRRTSTFFGGIALIASFAVLPSTAAAQRGGTISRGHPTGAQTSPAPTIQRR